MLTKIRQILSQVNGKVLHLVIHIPISFFVKYRKTKYDALIQRDVKELLGYDREHKRHALKALEINADTGIDLDTDWSVYSWDSFLNADGWEFQTKILALIAVSNDIDYPDDLETELKRISDLPNNYFRDKEFYEEYITSWIRVYCNIAICMLSERLRPYMKPIFDRYDTFASGLKLWSSFISGSNASAINAGLALHHLLVFMMSDNRREEKKALRRYKRYYKRYIHHLQLSYSKNGNLSSPHEGIAYATFEHRTSAILGLVQHQLGLTSVFDLDEFKGMVEYVKFCLLPDGTYHPSGDARGTRISINPFIAYYQTVKGDKKQELKRIIDTGFYGDRGYFSKIFKYD